MWIFTFPNLFHPRWQKNKQTNFSSSTMVPTARPRAGDKLQAVKKPQKPAGKARK